MLKQLLYQAMDWIAMVHDKISRLNDQFEGTLSDKQMHFLVIGVLGLLLIFGGFICMFAVFALVRAAVTGIARLIRRRRSGKARPAA